MGEVSGGDQQRYLPLLLRGGLQGWQQHPGQAAGCGGAAQPADAHRRNGKGGHGGSAATGGASTAAGAATQGVLQEGQLISQAVLPAATEGRVVNGAHRQGSDCYFITCAYISPVKTRATQYPQGH